jgi:hypothetical protein
MLILALLFLRLNNIRNSKSLITRSPDLVIVDHAHFLLIGQNSKGECCKCREKRPPSYCILKTVSSQSCNITIADFRLSLQTSSMYRLIDQATTSQFNQLSERTIAPQKKEVQSRNIQSAILSLFPTYNSTQSMPSKLGFHISISGYSIHLLITLLFVFSLPQTWARSVGEFFKLKITTSTILLS